jgi:hypothetical protein
VKGKISVTKVPGGFHIAPGRNVPSDGENHNHDLSMYIPNFDLSHEIERLRFGSRIPGGNSPLEGESVRQGLFGPALGRYMLTVTPLTYVKNGRVVKRGYEYSALTIARAVRFVGGLGPAPGIFFHYRFTPYAVTIHATSRSFAQYLVSTCGFLTGSFALAMLVDVFLHETDLLARLKRTEEPLQK